MKMAFLKVLRENVPSTFENEDGFSEGSEGESDGAEIGGNAEGIRQRCQPMNDLVRSVP